MTASAWLRVFHRAAVDAPVLVCFPHAGGAANWYRSLSAALAPAVSVVAVRYPGRHDRRAEPPVPDLVALAERVAHALPHPPYAFFGHSMGATIAFETARTLVREGASAPIHLFTSARRSPTRNRREWSHEPTDADLLAEAMTLGAPRTTTPAALPLLRAALPALRADYQAVETYRYLPGPPLTCPITALTGTTDPKTTPSDVEAWQELTTAPFTHHTYEGGHFFVPDHLAAIATMINSTLTADLPADSIHPSTPS
ncbi:thioesterase domain-containing protein [Actinosynnema sp. NPDC020468]|uniref:thioesterase II family protein n=1 Tax=Actinosynnema sp. NPDC020468 TaxID=3154488 RepID=UPI003403CBEC